ncbi:ImmA/IrrE family metallo-endopeptidase [Anaerotruncus rubiinfantis]|uniref:ImmA/IrrE family metallo-endopeptidase n=1 Tax=Anaerotruncus rubiinfantis TaxID=1720200 RepID=UPI00083340BE|nr:ImmA/IrrE family metallo-endopeptidase [Anaerotruncus rubiinfantis]
MAEVNVYVNRYADYARAVGHRPPVYGTDQGFAYCVGNDYMVFINERDDIDEQIHTLAHECAHIALGHIGPNVDAEE